MRPLIIDGNLRPELLKCSTVVVLFGLSFLVFPGTYGNSRFYYDTAVLLLFTDIEAQVKSWNTVFSFMGRLSLWIFLLHYPIALAAAHHLPRLAPHPVADFILPVADFILLSLLVLAASVAASALARRLYTELDAATRRLLAAALTLTK